MAEPDKFPSIGQFPIINHLYVRKQMTDIKLNHLY